MSPIIKEFPDINNYILKANSLSYSRWFDKAEQG